jgi:hypothetical protein
MYVEDKSGGLMEGAAARIGWVQFSRSGLSITYRGMKLLRMKGGGVSGNYMSEESRNEFWVSGVKVRGSNAHSAESVSVLVDDDAVEELARIRAGK